MSFNKTNQKSNIKKLFRQEWSEGFNTGRQEHDSHVTIVDSIQMIKSIYKPKKNAENNKETTPENVGTIIKNMKRDAEYTLSRTKCDVYVICFDKTEFVALAKGVEQSKRDSHKKFSAADMKKLREKRPYLDVTKPLPENWELAKQDRSDTMPHIISFICEKWINDPEYAFKIPAGKRIIIDGHCLSWDKIKKFGIKGIETHESENSNTFPISLRLEIDNFIDGKMTKNIVPNMKNCLGEADFTMFFLHRQLSIICKQPLNVDIFSNDTDMLVLALIQHAKFGSKYGNIYIKYDPAPRATCYDQPFLHTEEWIDISTLYRAIEKTQGLKKNQQDARKREKTSYINTYIFTLIAAMATAGGDYIEGYHGLTHEHLLNSLKQYYNYIQPIVVITDNDTCDITLDPEAYKKFIKTAYILANKKTRDNDPRKISVRELRYMTENLKKGEFPDDDFIVKMAFHLLYYMKLICQIGDASILDEGDVTQYYYAPEDPNNELHRENVKRLH